MSFVFFLLFLISRPCIISLHCDSAFSLEVIFNAVSCTFSIVSLSPVCHGDQAVEQTPDVTSLFVRSEENILISEVEELSIFLTTAMCLLAAFLQWALGWVDANLYVFSLFRVPISTPLN
jgi:hypothetical protein